MRRFARDEFERNRHVTDIVSRDVESPVRADADLVRTSSGISYP